MGLAAIVMAGTSSANVSAREHFASREIVYYAQ